MSQNPKILKDTDSFLLKIKHADAYGSNTECSLIKLARALVKKNFYH